MKKKIYDMSFSKVYQLIIAKEEKKHRRALCYDIKGYK